ncbi:hypothetical protein RUND412_003180 [Rhizina undulata]
MNALLYKSVEAASNPSGTIPDTDDAGNILYSPSELEEIENGIHQLETLLENTIDKNFDRFELFVLRNILNIPEDLVGQRKVNESPAHEEHVRLKTLRQRLQASQALNIKLHAEAAKNERAIAQLRAIVSASEPSQFSFLAARAKETSEADAEEKAEKGTPEEERRRLIERMARRHIKVSRDLRLDATGEIVGDYEFDGVLKEDLGDVEALENFVEKVRGDPSNVE